MKKSSIYMTECECCGKRQPEISMEYTIGIDGTYRRCVCKKCYKQIMKQGCDEIDSYAIEDERVQANG